MSSPSSTPQPAIHKKRPIDIIRFYNNRYSNQHAAAQEEDIVSIHPVHSTATSPEIKRQKNAQRYHHDLMMGHLDKHGSVLRHPGTIQQALNELDSEKPFPASLKHLVALQAEMVTLMHHMIAEEKQKIPRGQVYSFTLTFTSGSKVTHLDFLDPVNIKDLPANAIINVPQSGFYQIHVYNDGTGDISFATNLDLSDAATIVTLKSGEDVGFEYQYPVVETLNIVSPNPPATVRIVGVI